MSEAVDYAAFPVLGDLDAEIRARLLPHCRIVDFADDAVILQRDQTNDYLHFLLEGQAEVHFDLANRSDPIVINQGQMFGEISIIDQMPVTAFVVAAGPCRVLLVPGSIFWAEIVTVPGVARTVMRRLSQMLRSNSLVLVRAMQERLRHAALERELHLARDIQMGMLRHTDTWLPERRDVRIAALIEPARLVGGDFYDAFLLDDERLVLAVGDVSGKGISASLFMVRGLTLLRSPASQWVSLEKTLQDANRVLAEDNDTAMFLTLFMAVLDLRTGTLDYMNFGHPHPLLRRADGSAAFQHIASGVVFGVVPSAAGAAGQIALSPGDTLLLYSDGVTEAEDSAQRQLGADGLLAAVEAAGTDDPGKLVRSITAAIRDHAGDAEQSDDITLMAVTWHGPGATP
ncbi:MAG: SpoIIE family protein phosphatase [Acetobacteraceae bacterium]|nr:SpoIIE family protein phosphatase [Pseudomonadota bacterium]